MVAAISARIEEIVAGAGVATVADATAPSSPRVSIAVSIALRIAAMCSGVVPQHPPTMAAPASSMSPTIRPK